MRNKYTCISGLSIAKYILIVLLVILPNVFFAQQSPSIQTGVTFQWDDTQSNNSDPATIQSITIDGTVYNTFVVPSSYEMTTLGPDGANQNNIRLNGGITVNNSNSANWVPNATSAFQSKNLNHYFESNDNGRNICEDFAAATTTDAQKQTIFYSPAIPSNQGGVLAVTERGGNNCFYIEVWGIPAGGGPEQKLGETFVRNQGNYTGCTFGQPLPNSDYWRSGRCNENGQTVGVALFYLDNLAPTGSEITKIEFVAATRDHGDGKFFILQKYAVDDYETGCINDKVSGDIGLVSNAPTGSTYSLISGPSPVGEAFNLNADGTYSYTPSSGFTGSVTFTYEVCLPAPNTSVCDQATVTLNFVDLPPQPTASVSCGAGVNNFIITVNDPIGPEYEYSLNNGPFQSDVNFTGLSEGSYVLSIRNVFTKCEVENAVPITIQNLELTALITDVACKLEDTGAIDITVSGGKPPYTYLWNNTATSEDISNVFGGTYTVTVTDANGCTISDSFTINQPTEKLTSTIVNTNDVLCFGDNTGSIDIEVNGGTAPYTYLWNNGETTQDLTNLTAGTYTVTITDSNGCEITDQATIAEPSSGLAASVSNIINVDCNGQSNGSLTVNATGGTSPYEYSIDNGINNQTSGLFENLVAGTYTVLVTDSNNCVTMETIEVTAIDNENPTISVPAEIILEGCSASDITSSSAVFEFNEFGSNDVQTSFSSNINYNASDDSGIESITYNDVVTSTNDCPVIVTRTFTIIDTCGNSATASQTITVQDTTPPTISVPADITIECGQDIPPINDVIQNESFINSSNYSVSSNEYSISAWFNPVNSNNYEPRNITIPNNLGFGVEGNISGDPGELGANSTGTEIIRVDFSVPQLYINVTFGWKNPNEDAYLTFYLNNQQVGTTKRHYGGNDSVNNPILFTTDTGEAFDRVEFSAPYAPGDSDHDYVINTITFKKVAPEFEAAIGTDSCGLVTISGSDSETTTCGNTKTVIRTWTATDVCGNSVSANQTITVVDTTAPTFNEALPTDVTVECDAVPTAETLTANDNCGTATVTFNETTTAGTCDNDHTLTRTWTASDACGNETIHTQVITVQDTVAPTFNEALPTDTTVECDAVPTAETLTANDNCGTATVTFNETTTAGTCDNDYTLTRTWTASDACGNETIHTQTISVQDTTAPTFNEALPTDVTVECDAVPTAETLTADDNCGDATVNFEETTTVGTCDNDYTLTRTWTATDACGNETVHTQVITVQDTTAPTFNESLPADTTVECDAVPTAETLTASDNCGTATVTFNETTTAGTCDNDYTLTRTWTATDACGNETVHTQVITVQDTVAPTFNEALPTDTTVECDAVPTAETLTADDNCGTATVTFNETTTAGTCDNDYTLTRTWTATDACGNETVHTQVITVQDTVAPTFNEALPADTTVECDAVPTAETLTASDNCGTATVTFEETTTAGTCDNDYTLTRTWTATDACGNETIHTQVITVQDTTAPTFNESLPADVTVECDDVPTAETLTADDNCGTATITFEETTTAGTCDNDYTLTRTWTATDACGNETVHTQVITVQDTTAPTVSVPADITIECTDDESSANTGVATGADTCGTVTITQSDVETAACGNTKTIVRTWTVTDECGNSVSADQTITVVDTTPPTIDNTNTDNIVIQCGVTPDGTLEAWLANNAGATANDTCGTVTWSNDYGANTDVDCANGAITVTFTATDDCGNASTTTATYAIIDTVDPVLTIPADTTVECTEDTSPASTGTATATDDCAVPNVTFSDAEVAQCGNTKTITRTWTATDACGNSVSADQTITVVDTTAPTFNESLPTDTTVECDAVPTAETLTANDNCGTATVTFNETTTAGTCDNDYTLTRTWTATDACGNETVHTQVITVQDTVAPTFNEALPADTTVECDAVPTAETLTANDNCGTATVTFNETTTAGTCDNDYTLTRTWTATDACGNETIHTQVITVQDTMAPTFNEALPADVTVECDAVPAAETLTASDNCGTATITFEETTTAGTCDNDYTLTRTWTASDACGNETVHTQVITVQDTTGPTFNEALPADTTVECDAVPTAETLTADDNCGTATVTFNETTTAGTCDNDYTLTRTWTASDACGNETIHTQVITVQDTTAPTFNEALPTDVTVECDAVPTAETLTANDNCGTATVTFNETTTAGTCDNDYTLTRTWTASDACGNETIHTQVITVQDTTAPTFNEALPTDVTVECDAVPTAETLTASDNCGDATVNFEETTTAGTCDNDYTLTRTWTASDACGNETIHNQVITVQDTTAPTVSVPADITIECTDDESSANTGVATGADTCGTVTITQSDVETAACGNTKTIVRTWTVTDECGNSVSADQTITVVDTTPPTIDNTNTDNIVIQCGVTPDGTLEAWLANNAGATANDTCGTVTWSNDYGANTDVDCANGAITVTFTATDDCGNASTTTATYAIIDTVDPVLTIPADTTVECTEDTSPASTGTATATDDCAAPNVTFSDVEVADCGNTKTITRTWTATDACGNSVSADQTITVVDTTAPTFNEALPTDVTVECDAVPTAETLTANDNCGTATVTFNETTTAGTCDNDYTLTRTWTATDACGNETVHTQVITVQDTVAPTFNEALPTDTTVECDAVPTAETLTANDNCGTATVTFNETTTAGTCDNDYTLTRTWTASDACGNETIHTQVITVQDTTAPTFNEALPTDVTVECDAVPTAETLTANDNCGTATVTFNETTTAGTCDNDYTLTRTWTASDACGNETIHTQVITVQDTTAPTFNEALPTDVTVECDAVPTAETLTANDNCGTATVTFNETTTAGTCDNDYTLTRTWTASDACGNETIHTQVITVQDTTAPTFNEALPTDVTVECDAVPTAETLTASDNCGDATVNFEETTTAGTCDNDYTLTRTWTASDACGNETIHNQVITVQDTTAPTVSVPADITIECTDDESSANTGVATGADTCGTVTITQSDVETAACGNTKTIVRTWTVTDECGNSVSADQTITVVDTTPPTIDNTNTDNIVIQCGVTPDGTLEAWLANNAGATANDTCGTVTWSNDYGANTDVDCANGAITVTFTATDDCGNASTTTATYAIIDTVDPVLTIPADTTVECTEDTSPASTGTATATDDCAAPNVTFSDVEVADCGNTKTITRTWTATDACGNSVSADQTITVVDTTAPTFNEALPTDVTVECDAVPTAETLTASDNCGDATVNFEETTTAGTCDNDYTLTRTWTASDACGNETIHNQVITVQDTVAPTFNEALPADTTVECDAVPTAETLTADDNCGTATVTFNETTTAGTCDNDYTLTRTWTATDACGNETAHTQVITVQDTVAPTFNEALPADTTVECDAVPTAETLTASDNCGTATVTFNEEITDGACMGDYIIERTWTAMDACGNDTIHIQIITVQDTTAPTLVNPFDENIVASCDDIPEAPELVFEDACSNNISVSETEVSTQTNDFEDYSIIRTWTVTDDCGNVAEFTQNITVEISNVIDAFDANRCVLDSEFDLFELLSGNFSMDGTWSVVSGDASIDGSLFDPSSVEVGVYTFMYSITEGPCPTEVEVNVTIDDDCVVLPCGAEDVVISKTVTANGDSYNEFFTISGVEDCGFVVELQIFNRWGAEIYKNNNYQNDWNGDAHGSSVGNSGKVPTGTYYYVINLRNSGLKPFAGPIYVATDK